VPGGGIEPPLPFGNWILNSILRRCSDARLH